MKGIIFNLLEGQVEHQAGASAWDGLLDDAGLDGGYSAIGDYPTSELEQLVAAQARRAGTTERDAVRSFGHGSLLTLAEGFPDFFTPHDRTVDFLLTLNDVIHRRSASCTRPPDRPSSTSPSSATTSCGSSTGPTDTCAAWPRA